MLRQIHSSRAVINAVNGGLSLATPTATSAYTATNNRLTSSWANYDAAATSPPSSRRATSGRPSTTPKYKQRFYCGGTTAACSSANDGEGNRVKKIASGETVTYVYDAFGSPKKVQFPRLAHCLHHWPEPHVSARP